MSPDHEQIFFGDLVDHCFKVQVQTGQTLVIPSGWIHACVALLFFYDLLFSFCLRELSVKINFFNIFSFFSFFSFFSCRFLLLLLSPQDVHSYRLNLSRFIHAP